MRMTISWSFNPTSLSTTSMRPTPSGVTRSDSARASPQVGSAGQAMEARRMTVAWLSTGTPCPASSRVVRCAQARGTLTSRMFCDGVKRKSGLNCSTTRRNPVFKPVASGVLDAPVLHKEAQEKPAVELFVPAVKIALFGEGKGPRLPQVESQPFLQLLAEPGRPPLRDDVFEPRMFPIGPVSKVTMYRHDPLGRRNHLVPRNESDDIGQAPISLRVAVAHSHASPGNQIVARQSTLFDDGDKPAIVREYVNVVERRNGEGRP